MTLPFVGKAIHIDDTIYIYTARQILHEPLNPYGFQLNWLGTTAPALQGVGNPPFLPYYLSLLMALFGESELVLHGGLILFPMLAACSAYFLALRFTAHPLPVTLLLLLAPPFFLGASSLMLDVPALSLFLTSTALFVYGIDDRNKPALILAGVSLGLAFLTKYWPILNFPFLLFYAWKNKRTRDSILPLGLAALISIGWIGIDFRVSGNLPPFLTGGWVVQVNLPLSARIVSFLSFAGTGMFACACFLLSGSRKKWAYAGACIAAASVLTLRSSLSLPSNLLLFLLVLNGGFLLGLAIAACANKKTWADADGQFLVLWLAGTLAFTAIMVPYVAMRHMLIFLFPLILILFRSMDMSPNFKTALPINLALTFSLSLALSIGDFIFSNAYRQTAKTIYEKIEAANPAFAGGDTGGSPPRVWILSHWGFQYYMENRGAKILGWDNIGKLRAGDWVINTRTAHSNFIPQQVWAHLQLQEEIHSRSSWPVRLMNQVSGAGWYAQMWGPLPFTLNSDAELETFYLYRNSPPG